MPKHRRTSPVDLIRLGGRFAIIAPRHRKEPTPDWMDRPERGFVLEPAFTPRPASEHVSFGAAVPQVPGS